MSESGRLDLIVVGGGSGGLAAAQRAAEYGARVAVVEHRPLGGTCVNVGCVPKKIMWNAASLAHGLVDARDYGFELTVKGHDWSALKDKRDAYIKRLNEIYERNLAKKNIDYISAFGRFDGPTDILAGARSLNAEHIIIAVGGSPTAQQYQ